MRILLADDQVRQRRAGKTQLETAGHEVTVVGQYNEARELAKQEPFDFALIDLLMPAEASTLGDEGIKHLGEQDGFGFPLAIELAHLNVGAIAVVTDMNHHNHPMAAVVDWFLGRVLSINNKTVIIRQAVLTSDGNKNWLVALEELFQKT